MPPFLILRWKRSLRFTLRVPFSLVKTAIQGKVLAAKEPEP
ncbi:hypothetical protein GEOBRER4_n3825 [Citrifermentans bremense]|uniref:Uncharacterized protein n=1 Tax=Citrifermentans bremense TaxID=60035 RepID=A0A7R7FSM4_9BACT|nr:hypothetical protein GEOBRER4_n3825 [Citrifermentans bremense]